VKNDVRKTSVSTGKHVPVNETLSFPLVKLDPRSGALPLREIIVRVRETNLSITRPQPLQKRSELSLAELSLATSTFQRKKSESDQRAGDDPNDWRSNRDVLSPRLMTLGDPDRSSLSLHRVPSTYVRAAILPLPGIPACVRCEFMRRDARRAT